MVYEHNMISLNSIIQYGYTVLMCRLCSIEMLIFNIDVKSTSFNDVYLLEWTMPECAFRVICGIFLRQVFINCIFNIYYHVSNFATIINRSIYVTMVCLCMPAHVDVGFDFVIITAHQHLSFYSWES